MNWNFIRIFIFCFVVGVLPLASFAQNQDVQMDAAFLDIQELDFDDFDQGEFPQGQEPFEIDQDALIEYLERYEIAGRYRDKIPFRTGNKWVLGIFKYVIDRIFALSLRQYESAVGSPWTLEARTKRKMAFPTHL